MKLQRKPRTIRSLALQCIKRYPVPMTAWQIAKLIGKKGGSVSSELVHMRREDLVLCFESKDHRILYAPNGLNAGVRAVYEKNGDHLARYDCKRFSTIYDN